MVTAFVLSGGASLGAVHVGMLRCLAEEGIAPDLIVATSVGAMNGGWIASRSDPAGLEALADLWQSPSRADVFPANPVLGLEGFLRLQPNLVSDSGLRRLLFEHLDFTRLEDAPIPLHVVTTDVISGHDVVFSTGDAVDAITASAAIPAVFYVALSSEPMESELSGGMIRGTPVPPMTSAVPVSR